ncbi:membrane protein insertase YidC [Fructobacillus sp. M1-13]|uniref:Membrane protein insertase YidC n=1 Tax=Fructobacillus papyriferae TaxID=2713171 RepID=A0ABS5QQH8_9LACO|nr:membrane protein insertase YidC [Fructobacillus papyriferae]MBS9335421.1 membrane protein insertase YidC [Fructobacillus papyriferae]MCD2158909.1 membrane protein insertase YidC [Fructobacillus papyriferae]
MKLLKRYATIAFVLFDIYLFTGGTGVNGRIYNLVSKPIIEALLRLAEAVGGVNAIGWAIIILTAIIRLILLPIMVSQSKNTTISQLKMQKLRPEFEKVQAAVKSAKSQAEQQAASMASMSLYRENNVSMTGGISWLTMAIQMPIFSGLYLAIAHANGLKTATFFGFELSSPQLVFSIMVLAVYLLQSYLTQLHVPAAQKKQTGALMWLMPVVIAGFTIVSSGALALYFLVGGFFVVIQALITHMIYQKLKAQVDRDFVIQKTADDLLNNAATMGQQAQAKTEEKRVRPEDLRPRDVTEEGSKTGRNAGKQRRS